MAEAIISPGVYTNENDQSAVSQGPIVVGAAIVGPTVNGIPYVPTVVTTYSDYVAKFGSTFNNGTSGDSEYFTSIAARNYFENGGNTLLVTRITNAGTGSSALSSFASASAPSSGSLATSFTLETLAWGAQMNNQGGTVVSGALPSGSADNVRWEVSNVNYTNGTFTLLVRSGNDNNNQKNILETWTNLSMDVNQPNYISRVIGDQKPVYTYSTTDGQGYVDYSGDFANQSRYIRVATVPQAQFGTFNNNGTYQAAQYSSSLPNPGSGSVNGAFNGGVVDTNLVRNMFENIISGVTNAQGFTTADYAPALSLLSNTDEYQFNLLFTPGLFLAGGNSAINLGANNADPIAVCEGRADALAVVDTVPYGGTIVGAATAANASNSSYAATYWPWCQVFSAPMGKLVWVPASVLMGGVFAFTDEVSAPWFAPAGVTRGGIPNVVKVERKLSLNDRNTLYADNVNPLATFPGEGVVVFGQKTLQQKASALDRVNVRRLLIQLKSFIGGVGRSLVFEQNTAVTRNAFLNQVNPYLDNVVQKQGLFAYKVVMDESNNTPDVVDRNQLIGQIYIQPTKTAEFVILDFTILPTGVEFPA
jgi:phage tail sheath protein FI